MKYFRSVIIKTWIKWRVWFSLYCNLHRFLCTGRSSAPHRGYNLLLPFLYSISSFCTRYHRFVLDIIVLYSISSFCTRYHRFVLDIIVLYSISSFYTWYYRFVLDIIVLYSISSFCTQYHRLSPHILNYWFIEPSMLVITYYCLLHSGLNSLKLSKGW